MASRIYDCQVTDIVRRIMMIAWLLLLSLFSVSAQKGQDNGVLQCGPQNVKLNSMNQMLLLEWDDDPSCSALHDELIYELVVLIADQQVHYDEVTVPPDQILSTHSWNWTSYLSLECASHSVRLNSQYSNQRSPYTQQQALRKQSSKTYEVHPRDRVFAAGSTATFCCILPAGEHFDKMYLTGYDGTNISSTNISHQIYTLTLTLTHASSGCINVICKTNRTTYGACTYVGDPPGDKDLQCETRDLESVECHWIAGRKTLPGQWHQTYQLLGSSCADGVRGRCSKKTQVDAVERNWTLTVENVLGKVELHDRAALSHRVHMLAPEQVTASAVNARNVSLQWRWTVEHYYNLNVTCQVNISCGETYTITETFGVGLNVSVFNDLIPNWTYEVTVRCRTAQHSWKWGDWSRSVNFHTKGDVPEALDVWMQRKEKQTIIIWKKPEAYHSHGDIIDYEVTWANPRGSDGLVARVTVPHNNHSVALSLHTNEEHITVSARNIYGSSSPSTIIIPSLTPDRTRVSTSRIIGANRTFYLSWPVSPLASCGFIVDWCPSIRQDTVDWVKVPPNKTSVSIYSRDFKDGLRYLLSIYACTQGAPVLLEMREGYVSETRIKDGLFKTLKYKQQGSDVEMSWDPIPLREQTAFIQGYTFYYQDGSNMAFKESTDDPEATSLTARHLKITSYTFTVTALTAVGECGNTSISATLNYPTDKMITEVVVALGVVFCGLVLAIIFCYRHWACIKHKVYPPIPKPVLTDKWLTSPSEHTVCDPHVDKSHHSEAHTVDTVEVDYKFRLPQSSYISQEDMPFVHTQTPKGYYNEPLKMCCPPPITVPTSHVSPHFRVGFPNLSYNSFMQPEGQQCSLGPGFQQAMIRCSGGYQPQSSSESFTEEPPDSPMSCVSAYILLPQAPST
ncbi:leukemia inhibitory factor receptor-like [Parambassis ranga]|uniref:Leukemia inhibitory factor receptor-like n=1 Tax=Parambassis ranga TaxID=210632 RepID=A0A6P7JAG4_9TELE|nr:leukemia inhibitory factor receptor-like [Parambassis ranga]